MTETSKKPAIQYITASILVGVLVVLDQMTKYLAIAKLKDKDPFVIIDGVFELNYLENRGMAFGMLQNKQILFFILGIVILAALVFYYIRVPNTKRMKPIRGVMIVIAAGAIGNMIDRLLLGYVVDFFYFKLINFPIFNVADIYVVVGIFFIAFMIFFFYKEDELSFIFGEADKKKNME